MVFKDRYFYTSSILTGNESVINTFKGILKISPSQIQHFDIVNLASMYTGM